MRGLKQRLVRLVALVGGVSIAALHLAVLARRVADGTLLSPLVAAQWLAALVVVAVLIALHRQGVGVFRGRSAAAIWIVITLLHGIVALPGGPGFVGVLSTVPVTDLLPVGVGLLAGTLAVLLGLATRTSAPGCKRSAFHRVLKTIWPASPPPLALAPRAPPA